MVKRKRQEIMSVPEWLPDWRNPDEYPDPETTSMTQWAWEFLRRNPQYQEDYRRFEESPKIPQEVLQRMEKAQNPLTVIALINRHAGVFWDSQDAALKSYLYYLKKFIPPSTPYSQEIADSFDPSLGLTGYEFGQKETREDFAEIMATTVKEVNEYLAEYPQVRVRVPYPTSIVSVDFDLRRPIVDQIQAAEGILKDLRDIHVRNMLRRTKVPRARTDLYRDYLRILDAETSGIDANEIANVILPDVPNKYPDYLGRKRVDANLKAAKRLRHRDYVYLLFADTEK